ncbi:MAG: hypothetical protein R2813_07635 [Flavobacteriales bacterium]
MEEQRNHRGSFEDAMREAMSDYTTQADAYVWDHIEAELREKKNRGIIWWFSGVAAAIVALVVGVGLLNTEQGVPTDDQNVTYSDTVKVEGIIDGESPSMIDEEVAVHVEKPEIDNIQNESKTGDDSPMFASAEPKDQTQDAEQNTTDVHKVISISLQVTDDVQSKNYIKSINVLVNSDIKHSERIDKTLIDKPESLTPMSIASLMGEVDFPDSLSIRESETYPIIAQDEPTRKKSRKKDELEWEDGTESAQPLWAMAANVGSGASSSQAGRNDALVSQTASEEYDNFSVGSPNTDGSGRAVGPYYDNYSAPFAFGVRAHVSLTKRIGLESGLTYSLMKASGESGITSYRLDEHFIGVPILVSYRFIDKKRVAAYTVSGILLDKGIASRSTVVTDDGITESTYKNAVRASGFQGGLQLGVGMNYKFAKRVGLYVQPTVSTWLINHRAYNARNRQLLWPSLNAGLRFDL